MIPLQATQACSCSSTPSRKKEGFLTYIWTRLDNGETGCTLREVLLDSKLTFRKPQDLLFASQIDRMDRCARRGMPARILASLIPHHPTKSDSASPRASCWRRSGLGKNIEAGMIIHQQLLTGRAVRVLIVVPESLLHQWRVVMLRRFNLHFSIFDEERYSQSLLDSDNPPFKTEQLVLCSLDFVRRN